MTAEQAIAQLKRPNGGIDPQIQAAATEVVLAAQAAGYEVKAISWFNPSSTPEHHVPGMAGQKGVAVDFMCDRATGDWVADYLWTHRVRLGLCWEIWRDRIRSTSPGKPGTWQNRGQGDHYDHVHGNFGHLVGANGYNRVNKITYAPATRPPLAGTVWLDRLVPGVADSDSVRLVQRALGIAQSGTYDPATVAAVKAKQQAWGDDPKYCDGVLGPKGAALLFTEAGLRVDIRTDPSGQAPKPTPTPKPTPEPPMSAQITAAYGNILRRTDTLPGRKRWPDRKANVVKHLKSTGASVIMLCEVDKTTAADIATGLGEHWAYYPSQFATGKTFSPLAIMWDTDVWRRDVDAFVREYSDRENRFLQRLPLVHRATSKPVVFYASHLENDGDPATDGHVARRTESREWAKLTLDQPGIWGADLNSTTPSAAAATQRQKEKPRPILKAAGWRMLSDQAGVANREYASHHGGKSSTPKGPWIDDMGFRGLTYLGGALVRTDGTDASDHHFLSVTVKF